eukprot:TRINITY_DN7827_c0_g1_i1.p1 TRINITY_DN7827_c0_g1~~TRINITY_DN7827_c0_g1_i1.p1  ORF type:complete len:531 (-),score=123.57 TRINITY_DN7827_c0_g1_i1:31-1623(-)
MEPFKAHIEIEDEEEDNYDSTKRDGARSSTRGLCDCGYKHWLHGIEYDFVVKPEGFSAILGFNVTDNVYLVAEQFVIKNDRSKDLNHRNKINALVDFLSSVRQKALLNAGITQPLPPTQETKFDPTKPIFSIPNKNLTHYNKVTGKFETSIYKATDLPHYTPEEVAENVRKAKLLQEESKKIDEEIKKREKATSSISDRVKMDRQEVEAEAKLRNQIQSYKKESPSKANMTRVVKNGVIEYVETSSLQTHSSEAKFADIQGLHSKKSSHPKYCEHCDAIHDDDDDDDDEHDHDHGAGKRVIAIPAGALEQVNKIFDQFEGKIPKELWADEVILLKIVKDSPPFKATQKLMLESGFDEFEVHLRIKGVLTKHLNISESAVAAYLPAPSFTVMTPTKVYAPRATGGMTASATTATVGHSLSPSVSVSVEPSPPPAPEVSSQEAQPPAQLIQLEENKPTTSIRVRLIDGKTITVTLHMDNTVEQLHNHLRAVSNVGAFKLMDMTSRPSKALTDMTLTIEKANIARGSISQVKQ